MLIPLQFRRLSSVWLLLAIAAGAITLFLGYRYVSLKNKFLMIAQQSAQQETQEAAVQLNKFITMLKPLVDSTAQMLSKKNLNKKELIEYVKQHKPIDISGFGVAYLPYAFDEHEKLFAPYYFEMDGKEVFHQIGTMYDYTQPEYTWFNTPLTRGPGFIDPYYGKASQTILAEYSTPIYRMDQDGAKKAIGIVYANQSVEHLKHILDTLFLDQTGYWAILTKKGTFLAHPQDQLVHRQKTIFDIAQEINNPDLNEIGKQIVAQKKVFFEYKNEITNSPSWLFSAPLEGTDWSIVGVFDKSELDINPKILRQNLIYPSLVFVLFILFLSLFLFSIFDYGDHPGRWWFVSAAISLALAGQICWTWYATTKYPTYEESGAVPIRNRTQLFRYLKKEGAEYRYGRKIDDENDTQKMAISDEEIERRALTQGHKDPRYVPTGIYVNNLQFISSTEIRMSAYIWQRLNNKLHGNVAPGIILPQATQVKINEISRIKTNTSQVVLYEVFANINQFLTFYDYPFDAKSVNIQINPKYTKENIILVPDLDSYQLINPRSLPGIDDGANMPGWNVIATHFGYRKVNLSSNFGAYSVGPFGKYHTIDKSSIPEFSYNLLITRKLLDKLISDLLPVAVIAVLLFIILLASTSKNVDFIGWSSTVFFATVFAQIQFREKIPQAVVVYFESFYFLMYLFILLLLINSILYKLGIYLGFMNYKENLIARLLYWPALLTALMIITMLYLF